MEGKDKKTNEQVWREVTEIFGERPETIVETIKRRKLKYYGHQTRKQTLTKAMIEGRVEGSRGKGRPSRQWEDDLKQWSMEGLRRAAGVREWWRRLVHNWVRPTA